jgi:HNH endonuclease
MIDLNDNFLEDKELKVLFKLADEIGNKHYHRLTPQDFQDYLQYDRWRYVNADFECGTTQESRLWVNNNSGLKCPICTERYQGSNYKTVDHKLPRSHYPWLSMEFDNLWVICRECNIEKSDLNWFEYEQYIFSNYSHRYPQVKSACPVKMLQSLKTLN